MTHLLHSLAGSMLLLAAGAAAAESCTVRSPTHRVALVELYTAQGCSSCPPADRWLSRLGQRFTATQAIPMALHVGYWDYIGWKDPFARREFNERQREWAAANGSRSVYTPGVFVQGRELRDWSSAAAIGKQVQLAQAQPAGAAIELSGRIEAGQLKIDVQASPAANSASRPKSLPQLRVALLQSGLLTAVKAGENRGEQLSNDHVVRDWSPALALGRHQLVYALPSGVPVQHLAVVAFVQSPPAAEILQALRWSPSACTS